MNKLKNKRLYIEEWSKVMFNIALKYNYTAFQLIELKFLVSLMKDAKLFCN